MNRRTFLKSIIGTAVLAAIPISFNETLYIDDGTGFQAKELQKALQIGPGNLCYGSALQIEDLSATLKLVTFDDKHIKLHKNFYE